MLIMVSSGIDHTLTCLKLGVNLLKDYVTISSDGRILVLHNAECIECLFNLFEEESLRKQVLEQVLALFRVKLCFISNFPLLTLL